MAEAEEQKRNGRRGLVELMFILEKPKIYGNRSTCR